MSYELIISEKPQAAQKIAIALDDKSKPAKHREYDVNYYVANHNGKQLYVASAVGHLFGLGEKGGESWKYPIFDTEWRPIYENNKEAKFTKDYIKLLEKLSKGADEVTIASDYDVEGEVIGLNVVRFIAKRKDANRMKFSTLTKPDLIKAYETKQNHLEWGQAKAGETRHTLDWYYGINLSRAFTQSIRKATRQFKVLSTGRVQAPALHFLAERERKIQKFVPEKFSEVYLHGKCRSESILAQYELPLNKVKELNEEDDEGEETKVKDRYKIFDNSWAEKVVSETSGKNGVISKIESKQFKQAPPMPFDLTSLQMEASSQFGISPKQTLEVAQKLYIEGITSYPRTSSQKLPKELNLKNILEKLEKFPNYRELAQKVKSVNPSITPFEGKKEDPAHPAIHPTGEVPSTLSSYEQKIYDLIVKRFFACFGKFAVRETNTVTIAINEHNFILKGTKTIERNWHELYEPYLRFEEVEIPHLEEKEVVENKKIEKKDKETTPPKRYSDASIIKELEKRNLGTKATRAEILNNLRERGYIVDKSIKVTPLGLKMDEVLASETPKLVDEVLTRQFEEDMENIRAEKEKSEKVLDTAKKELLEILETVKKNEVELGKKLADASSDSTRESTQIAKCPNCETGFLVLKMARATKKKFVACNKYPECKTIFSIPQEKIIKPSEKDKEEGKICILVGKSEKSLKKVCLLEYKESMAKFKTDENRPKHELEGSICPKCNTGKMVLRKSFYGEFLGCNNYPKCKNIININGNNKKKEEKVEKSESTES